MQMNALIPMQVQSPDLVGSMARGVEAARMANTAGRENALANLYRTQGAGIMAGDQNALNALAQQDPAAALGIQSTRQSMALEQKRFDVLTAQERRAAEQYARGLSAEQAQAEAAKIEQGVKMGMQAQTPEQWDALMQQYAPDLVGQFDNRQMLASKYMGWADILKGAERPAPLTDAGKLAADKENGWVDPNSVPQADLQEVDKFRKEFSGLPAVKDFNTQAQAYSRIIASASNPSAAGDLALIFNYMKMLDPGSVVREGEFATAQNAASVPDRIRAAYNNAINGERLAPTTRADFMSRATQIYDAAEADYGKIEGQFRSIAEGRNYPVDQSIINFRYQGERPQAESEQQPAPDFRAMTDDELNAWIAENSK